MQFIYEIMHMVNEVYLQAIVYTLKNCASFFGLKMFVIVGFGARSDSDVIF